MHRVYENSKIFLCFQKHYKKSHFLLVQLTVYLALAITESNIRFKEIFADFTSFMLAFLSKPALNFTSSRT